MTSYSALSRRSHGHHKIAAPDASMETPGHDIEVAEEQSSVPIDEFSLYHFPKGARPGTFMHSLFEDINMNLARSGEVTEFVSERLLQRRF